MRLKTLYSIFTYLLTIVCATQTNAQQLPLFTQYREQLGIINPAAPATGYFLYGQLGNVGATVRRQWIGKQNAPQTQLLHGSYMSEGSGVSPLYGGHIINDKVGRVSTTGVYGRFAGILSEDPAYNGLSFGLTAGIVQYRVDLLGVIARDPDDELILNADLHRKIYPDVGLGVYAWQQLGNDNDYVFGGISIPQTLGLNVSYRLTDTSKFNLDQSRHFYGNIGYIKTLDREGSLIELNGWVKYVKNAPIHADINARYQIGYNFWVGAGYGLSKALHLEAGILLAEQRIKIGFGYDFNLSDRILAFGQSNEFNAAYGFGQSRAW